MAEWVSGEHSTKFEITLLWILERVRQSAGVATRRSDVGESAMMEVLGRFCRIVKTGFRRGSHRASGVMVILLRTCA